MISVWNIARIKQIIVDWSKEKRERVTPVDVLDLLSRISNDVPGNPSLGDIVMGLEQLLRRDFMGAGQDQED